MLYCVPKSVHSCSNGVAVKATNGSLLLNAALVLAITNRAENLCYQFEHGQKLLPQFRKIVCLVGAPVGWIPTVTLFPRNDNGGTPTPERILIQGVLINGMCLFADGTRAARRRENGAPSLTKSTRMRGILLRSRHAGEVA